MTATIAAPAGAGHRVPVTRVYRFELVKLLSQWRVRLLILASWVAPAVFVAVVSQQGSLPSDTVFGRWMHATGWAGPLVILGFSGTWALPLLTSVVAGDVFAAEDRLGTWRHLLVAVRSPRRIFLAKALASLTVILLLVAGLACSSAAAGVVDRRQSAAGRPGWPPAGAGGRGRQGAACLGLRRWPRRWRWRRSACSGRSRWGAPRWGCCCRRSFALAMQIAQMLPLPVAVRLALPGYAFIAWRGLFTSPMQLGPLLVGIVVSLLWAVVATALAYWLFLRRDFTNVTYDGSGRRAVTAGVLPMVALVAVTVAVIAVATPATGSGIEQGKLQRSLATAYAHLYRLQTQQLHRPDVTEAQLKTAATCNKGDGRVANSGPGNGWRCVVTWHLPGVHAVGTAIYQLDVTADGRYVADGDGPNDVNGYFLVRTPTGDAPNPLWQVDGTVDLLATPRKG